jgi:outer membrane protein TolC
MALKQNPRVQIANLSVAATQENQIVARSTLLPKASFEVSETVQRDNLEAFLGMQIPGFRSIPGRSGCSKARELNVQLVVSQPAGVRRRERRPIAG